MVEMLESRLMPSSLQGLGQAHRERSHHPKQAGPIQQETVANLAFEQTQFASLSADDSVPSCNDCSTNLPPEPNPILPPSLPKGVKDANGPLRNGSGIIYLPDKNGTPFQGDPKGYGSLAGKKLDPLIKPSKDPKKCDVSWQNLGTAIGCSIVVIHMSDGTAGAYHVSNYYNDDTQQGTLDPSFQKFLDDLAKGHGHVACATVFQGFQGGLSAVNTAKGVVAAIGATAGLTNSQGEPVQTCTITAQENKNDLKGPAPAGIWLTPNKGPNCEPRPDLFYVAPDKGRGK